MSIVVTGATGPFGRLAIEALLLRGIPARELVTVGRNVAKARRPAGARPHRGPRRLRRPRLHRLLKAFDGADRLLFVSGSEVGQRIPQHQAVVDAAADAGLGLVAYTSAPKADSSDMILAREHRATEQALIRSGLPYTFLRNSWYLENYTANLPVILEHGLIGAAGDGLISGAARADYAEAAAAVVAGEGHANRVYEWAARPSL